MEAAARVPTFFDCADPSFSAGQGEEMGPPPECAEPDDWPGANRTHWVCINRHDGGINMSFLDGSSRKVGLKELWTLKWHRQSNTVNRWTKAGGVQPEDWPEWMRNFRDY